MIVLGTVLVLMTIFFMQISHTFKFEPLTYLFRSLKHANFMHLFINLYSFWQLREMSDRMGQTKFLSTMVMVWLVSSGLLYLIHTLAPNTKVHTVGFSGVIIGLALVNNYQITGKLGMITAELLGQILPHFFIPGISFWGHLSGLMAGLAYVFLNQSR